MRDSLPVLLIHSSPDAPTHPPPRDTGLFVGLETFAHVSEDGLELLQKKFKILCMSLPTCLYVIRKALTGH